MCLRRVALRQRIEHAFSGSELDSDYGCRRLVLLALTPLITGAGRLGLRRLTMDIDGTVIRTGAQVAWAVRGFNPHQRKVQSYYPLLAHLGQTGQIRALRNRPRQCPRQPRCSALSDDASKGDAR